jgi:hypothetical protein
MLRLLFPNGTAAGGEQPTWGTCPRWPPDLFAAAAKLVDTTGCYALPRYASSWSASCCFDDDFRRRTSHLGRLWRASARVPALVQQIWQRLYRCRNSETMDPEDSAEEWQDAALMLMAIADEASEGIGFAEAGVSLFADLLFVAHRRALRNQRILPYLPRSICASVPPDIVCVQPKTRTPQVGCTLRSLSHHLALLPPAGEVETQWLFGLSHGQDVGKPLNLLVVPFPYEITPDCFAPGDAVPAVEPDTRPTRASGSFVLHQRWLRRGTRRLRARQIARFLIELVQETREEVHGVILPELALDDALFRDVAEILARHRGLELFVSGTKGRARNAVSGALFHRRRVFTMWRQSKHHRWLLDERQTRRYGLGGRLNPRFNWWEQIDVSSRKCVFYVFRDGAALTTLVCEDLARVDPVQTVIRSVGPNLVIALLMDGAQLKDRWPSQYATVLADDPGSAVLTLSSLGMIRRSRMPGAPDQRQVALWKEPGGTAQELSLPKNAHALLLNLTQDWEGSYTLDGRFDGGYTMKLSLAGLHSVIHPAPPAWLNASAE